MKTVKILIKKDSSPAPAESSSSSSTAVTGTLRVNYAVGQTAPEGGKWYLDGDEASQYNFGSEAQVEFGTHSVYLTDVEGYDAPSAQEVVIDSAETKTIECSPYILIESSSSSSSSEAVMTLPPNNEIWYYAPSQVTLNNDEDLSGHTFSDGKGVLTFNNDVTEVKDWFRDNDEITSVVLPSCVTRIDNDECAFEHCANLTLISLPDKMTKIGDYAFSMCYNLALSSLPVELSSIGSEAFSFCSSLMLTSLPSGLTSIGSYAFSGCSGIALTLLPSGLTYINRCAFTHCINLSSITLPASIEYIDDCAFESCTNLSSVTFLGTPRQLGEDQARALFDYCPNLCAIYVPWSKGDPIDEYAPWGATSATINYNYNGSSSSSSSEES